MLLYFIFSLGVSLTLAIALLVLLINRLQVNWTRQNKVGISFLLPVLITIILIFVIYLDTQPKVLDLINLFQGNTRTVEAKSEEIKVQGNNLIIDDQTLLISPLSEKISDQKIYRFSYLPNSKIVVYQEYGDILPVILEIPVDENSTDSGPNNPEDFIDPTDTTTTTEEVDTENIADVAIPAEDTY
ncbi:MAG TPA: hypothetical protein GXZ43_06895 [Clostridiaceae bacterium]|nr:hypothetical protein [Clostridiaceae bacterium]